MNHSGNGFSKAGFKLLMKKRKAGIELNTIERHNLIRYLSMLSMDETLPFGIQVAAKIYLANLQVNRPTKELSTGSLL